MRKVVDVFFHKAVQEQKFSGVYADLVMSVFETAQEEKGEEVASDLPGA